MRNDHATTESRLEAWGREVSSRDVPMPMQLRKVVDANSLGSRRRIAWRAGLAAAAVIAMTGVVLMATRGSLAPALRGPVVVGPEDDKPGLTPSGFRDLTQLPEPTTGMEPSRLRAGHLRSPEQAEAWFSQG